MASGRGLRAETTFAGLQTAGGQVIAASGVFNIPVGNSIFSYTAPFRMAVAISGGTVQLVTYGRTGLLIPTGLTGGLIELNAGDTVNVTWLGVRPTMTGIPR